MLCDVDVMLCNQDVTAQEDHPFSNRAIFLDRDGVINRSIVKQGKPYPPADLASLEILPGVKKALNDLADAGYLLIVVTNQPDVAKGITSKDTVQAIHEHLSCHLPIHAIYTCYHQDKDGCQCRKPMPGAILAATEKYNIRLQDSYMIGDRWRDVETGNRAGCKSIFIDYQYDEKQPTTMDFRVRNLKEAVKIILNLP